MSYSALSWNMKLYISCICFSLLRCNFVFPLRMCKPYCRCFSLEVTQPMLFKFIQMCANSPEFKHCFWTCVAGDTFAGQHLLKDELACKARRGIFSCNTCNLMFAFESGHIWLIFNSSLLNKIPTKFLKEIIKKRKGLIKNHGRRSTLWCNFVLSGVLF